MQKSNLQNNPRSKVLERGYINVYSNLNTKEKRQLEFNRAYKKLDSTWDNTAVLLCKYFDLAKKNLKNDTLVILDAGCGNGNYVIDEKRAEIAWATGVDVDKSATKKNICLDEIKIGNLEKLPFKDNCFDLVTSLWVIEHLENPSAVFVEIQRVLKPNGYFIFCTPNKNYFLLWLKEVLGSTKLNLLLNSLLYGRKEKDVFKTFYRGNTIMDLDKLLTSSGLKKIELKLNYDPGYTSFDLFTFKLSNSLSRLLPSIFSPHIVGMYEKIK